MTGDDDSAQLEVAKRDGFEMYSSAEVFQARTCLYRVPLTRNYNAVSLEADGTGASSVLSADISVQEKGDRHKDGLSQWTLSILPFIVSFISFETNMPSEYAPVYEKIMTDLQARADSNAHLLEVLKKVVSGLLPPGARVVDVGCGPGEPAASYLAGLGHKVTGLDFAQNVVDQAREKVPEAEFIKVDFREWEPPPGVEYDLVLVSHALYNFPLAQLRSLAFTFASWANAGGLVVVGQSIKCEAVEENTLPFDEDGWAEGVPNLFLGHVFRSTYAMADTWRRLFESTGLEFVSLDERICVRPGAPDKRNLASFITLRKTGKNPFFGPYPVLKSLPEPLPVGESNRGGWEEVLKRQKKGADTIEESVFEKVLYLGVGGGKCSSNLP